MRDTTLARRAVIARHARLRENGRPAFCQPSQEELSGNRSRRQGPRTDGKVIYDDRDSAEAAAAEFELLDGSASRPYACQRSRHGHFHLTRSVITVGLPKIGVVAGG